MHKSGTIASSPTIAGHVLVKGKQVSKLTLSSAETVAGQNEMFLPEYRDNGIPIHCLDYTSANTVDHSAAVQTYLGEDAAIRMAACWNACEGVPEGLLHDGAYREMMVAQTALTAQRDELLAALELARTFIGEQTVRTEKVGNKVHLRDNLPKITNTLGAIDAAIAKAKGGAA